TARSCFLPPGGQHDTMEPPQFFVRGIEVCAWSAGVEVQRPGANALRFIDQQTIQAVLKRCAHPARSWALHQGFFPAHVVPDSAPAELFRMAYPERILRRSRSAIDPGQGQGSA